MALDALFDREPPSTWEMILSAPAKVLTQSLQKKRSELTGAYLEAGKDDSLTVVCISDTHNHEVPLPAGDLLIHAGDLTQNGTREELQRQLNWLNSHPHPHKIAIAGNHDRVLQRPAVISAAEADNAPLSWGSVTYLEDSSVRLRFRGGRTLLVYGNPWTRKHGNWSFQYERGTDMFSGKIDDDADIVVTHSPPKHYLDVNGLGDAFLLQEIRRVRPRLHVFGHIHGGYGQERILFDRFSDTYQSAGKKPGIWDALKLLCMFLYWLVWADKAESHRRSTCLVNASIVGGIRDDHEREPQAVVL